MMNSSRTLSSLHSSPVRRVDRRIAVASKRLDRRPFSRFRSFLDGTDLCSRGLLGPSARQGGQS